MLKMANMPVLGPSTSAESETEVYSVIVPKRSKRKLNAFDFHRAMNVEFKDWSKVKLQRENNMTEYRGPEEEMPKFGAGSEFGRDAREEARKKKFGINSRKYKVENQPWILKTQEKKDGKGEKKEKKYKGIKKGGINDNATYYVFTRGPNNVVEAFPLHEWYKFQAIQNYKSLTAEEAEEEFMRRDKQINYFSLMARKRLKNNEEDDDEEEMLIGKKKSNKKAKDLKISEMDEWIDSEDEESDEEEDCKKKSDDEDEDKKKTKKDKIKKKKKVSDDEAFEESDDGDEEGRECDYISDSSASEGELELQKEIKSVDQEDALKKLLDSDEEDEEEDEENDDGSDSSSGVESSAEQKNSKKPSSSESSRSATPTTSQSLKRSHSNSPDLSQVKKNRMDSGASTSMSSFSTYVPGSSESGITEDAVRRYLLRKPMTTTELLQKFKAKKTSLTSEQIVTIMTNILKNLNPARKKIKDKTYFFIKEQPKK